jgi:hypothetical protein
VQAISKYQIPQRESSRECPPANEDKETSTKEALSSSWHPSKSENTKDFMSNQENQSTDCQLDANTMEALLSTEQSSTDDVRTTDIPVQGSSNHSKARNNLNKVGNDAEDTEDLFGLVPGTKNKSPSHLIFGHQLELLNIG